MKRIVAGAIFVITSSAAHGQAIDNAARGLAAQAQATANAALPATGVGAQSGAAAAIASASNQNAIVRAKSSLNITQRVPLQTDVTGYTAGVSTWLDQAGNPWLLNRINGGVADWLSMNNPGTYPASVVPGVTSAIGTTCNVAGWANAVLVLTRPNDGATKAIGCIASTGQLDVGTALAFAAPSGGIAYVTAFHDMSDAGAFDGALNTANDWTQSNLKNAPRLAFEFSANGNVVSAFDATYRNYLYNTLANWPVSNTSGSNQVCFTGQQTMGIGQPGLWFIQPGMTLSSSYFSGGVATITAFNYTTNCATMSSISTQAISLAGVNDAPIDAVYLNAPSSLSIGTQAHSVVAAVRFGSNNQLSKTMTYLGAAITFPSSPTSFVQTLVPGSTGSGTSMKVVEGTAGAANPTNIGSQWPSTDDQIVAYSQSNAMGSCSSGSGRCIAWQMDENQGIAINAQGVSSATLTGGGYGTSAQNVSTGVRNNDQFLYDLYIYGATAITPAQMTTVSVSEYEMRHIVPQHTVGVAWVGSSTSQGNGTSQPASGPGLLAASKTGGLQPIRVWNQGTGGGDSVDLYNFPTMITPLITSGAIKAVIYKPGEGNGFQQATTVPITAQSGTLMTTSTTLTTGIPNTALLNTASGNSALAPYVPILGTPSSCLPSGTTVLNIVSPTTFNVSQTPNSTCTSVTVQNETAANEIIEDQAYDSLIASTAPQIPYMKIGTFSRGSFSSPQLAEFNTKKAIMYSVCQPDVNGMALPSTPGAAVCASLFPNNKCYVDLEMDPYFGGDNAAMFVSAVVDSTHVTVGTLSNYAAVGNRIEWWGMPYNLAADTGGQTITGVSGTTLTVSASTSGMYVGELLRAINPAPWSTYPWPTGSINLDYQHPTPLGYAIENSKVQRCLLASGMLN